MLCKKKQVLIKQESILVNKYSCIRKRQSKKRGRSYLRKLRFKKYQYSVFFKRFVCNLDKLPFLRKKTQKRLIIRNKFFGIRRRLKKLSLGKKSFKPKKLNYGFFFLKFRKKRYKRRSSKRPRRKFFTNI
jgi:hypothetical protein